MTSGIPREHNLTSEEYYRSMGVLQHPITHTVVVEYHDGLGYVHCISLWEATSMRISFINYGKCKSVRIVEGEVSK